MYATVNTRTGSQGCASGRQAEFAAQRPPGEPVQSESGVLCTKIAVLLLSGAPFPRTAQGWASHSEGAAGQQKEGVVRGSGIMALVSYIRDKIEQAMESPEERDRKWEQHLRGVQAAASNA